MKNYDDSSSVDGNIMLGPPISRRGGDCQEKVFPADRCIGRHPYKTPAKNSILTHDKDKYVIIPNDLYNDLLSGLGVVWSLLNFDNENNAENKSMAINRLHTTLNSLNNDKVKSVIICPRCGSNVVDERFEDNYYCQTCCKYFSSDSETPEKPSKPDLFKFAKKLEDQCMEIHYGK